MSHSYTVVMFGREVKGFSDIQKAEEFVQDFFRADSVIFEQTPDRIRCYIMVQGDYAPVAQLLVSEVHSNHTCVDELAKGLKTAAQRILDTFYRRDDLPCHFIKNCMGLLSLTKNAEDLVKQLEVWETAASREAPKQGLEKAWKEIHSDCTEEGCSYLCIQVRRALDNYKE